MANGFRLTGGYYFCKSGNDSNNGLIDETPKKTIIETGLNVNHIIGAGYYIVNGILLRQLIGDGVVIFDYQNNSSQQRVRLATNIRFQNALNWVGFGTFINCVLKNLANIDNTTTGTVLITSSILLNCDFLNLSTTNNLNKNILVNSKIKSRTDIKDLYIDFNSVLFNTVNILNPQSTLISSNIQGIIQFSKEQFSDNLLKQYAIQDQLTGTPQDNGYAVGVNWLTEAQLTSDGYTGTISGWDAAVATCINRDPKFNNVGLEDFSLQADSPHIGRASDGGNIGGTDIANTVLVNQDGVGTIEINPEPEIDTTNPNFYTVATNEDEGYIDIIQRIGTQPIVLTEIEPIAALEFDSDIEGGNVGNQNVPDSEPQTADYPRKITTTSLAPDTTTLNVTGHDVVVGEFVRVLGEDREVTSVTTDTITVGTAFRAAVASGVVFQAGSEVQLAALRPNRLTYQLRVSTQATKPNIDAEWDNNIDPIYNYEGLFSTQEWFEKPGYVIDGSNVFGKGDAEANPAITPDEISATWVNIRVWLRNNYDS